MRARRVLGRLWGRLGGVLGRLGGVLGRLGRVLQASWAVSGASWSVLGASWGPLGASCAHVRFLIEFRSIFGFNFDPWNPQNYCFSIGKTRFFKKSLFEVDLYFGGQHGAHLPPFWHPKIHLGASWGVFGASWALLGASWRRLGGVLGRLGGLLGASWRILARLGVSWGVLKTSWPEKLSKIPRFSPFGP